jgi:hypothetical protein
VLSVEGDQVWTKAVTSTFVRLVSRPITDAIAIIVKKPGAVLSTDPPERKSPIDLKIDYCRDAGIDMIVLKPVILV